MNIQHTQTQQYKTLSHQETDAKPTCTRPTTAHAVQDRADIMISSPMKMYGRNGSNCALPWQRKRKRAKMWRMTHITAYATALRK